MVGVVYCLKDLARNETLLSEWFALINELDLVARVRIDMSS